MIFILPEGNQACLIGFIVIEVKSFIVNLSTSPKNEKHRRPVASSRRPILLSRLLPMVDRLIGSSHLALSTMSFPLPPLSTGYLSPPHLAHCPLPKSRLSFTYASLPPVTICPPRLGQLPSTASLKRLIASMWALGEDSPAFIVLTEISVAPNSFHFETSLTHSPGGRLSI